MEGVIRMQMLRLGMKGADATLHSSWLVDSCIVNLSRAVTVIEHWLVLNQSC